MSMLIDPYRFAVAAPAGGITFPITGVAGDYASTRSPSFTLGTAPLENDIIVAFVPILAGVTIADPSGWTNVLGSNVVVSATAFQANMHYHRVTAGEAAASTVTWTLTNLFAANRAGTYAVSVLRGVATSGELVGTGSTFDSLSGADPWVIASVTPTATGSQIMAGLAGDGSKAPTTPATHTQQAGTESSQSCYLYSDDDLGVNGVATGTTNVTITASDEYVSIVAAFAAA